MIARLLLVFMLLFPAYALCQDAPLMGSQLISAVDEDEGTPSRLTSDGNALNVNLDTDTTAAAIQTAAEAIQAAVEIMDDWDDSNLANVNLNLAGTDVTANAGAVAAGTPRVTLASDDPGVALLGTIDADTGNAVTALQIIDDWDDGNDHAEVTVVQTQTVDTSGVSFYTHTSTADANLTSITDGATTLYAIVLSTVDETAVYVRLYNKASAPDPSGCSANSDCPVFDIGVVDYAPTVVVLPPQGVYFSTGLGMAIVTDAAVTGETAVAANEVKVNLVYYHP